MISQYAALGCRTSFNSQRGLLCIRSVATKEKLFVPVVPGGRALRCQDFVRASEAEAYREEVLRRFNRWEKTDDSR